MIQYRCACGRLLQADDGQAGQQARCPGCQAVSAVPGRAEAIRAEPAGLSDDRDEPRPRRRAREAESSGAFPWVLVLVGVGAIGLVVCGGLVFGLLLPAVQKVREAASRMQEQNQLKQMSIAMHSLHDTFGRLPRQAIEDKAGKPLLSWRVAMLPYVEEENLYRQFRLDEPWDSDHNKQFIGRMPRIFQRGGEPPNTTGLTHFQAVVGKGLLFDNAFEDPPGKKAGRRFVSITDGTSNTVMIVVAKTPVIWTKPDDVDGDDPSPLWPRLDTRFGGGTNICTTDGAVRFLRGTSEPTLRAALTASGGELLGPDW